MRAPSVACRIRLGGVVATLIVSFHLLPRDTQTTREVETEICPAAATKYVPVLNPSNQIHSLSTGVERVDVKVTNWFDR